MRGLGGGAVESVLDDMALSRGYLVASSGLDVQGSNANNVFSSVASSVQ